MCYQSKIEIDRKEYLVGVMVNEAVTLAKVAMFTERVNQEILESDTMKVTYDSEVDVLRIPFPQRAD